MKYMQDFGVVASAQHCVFCGLVRLVQVNNTLVISSDSGHKREMILNIARAKFRFYSGTTKDHNLKVCYGLVSHFVQLNEQIKKKKCGKKTRPISQVKGRFSLFQ